MRGLKDKVVIVTGGGGGIGLKVCQRFSEEGSKVAVFDINKKTALQTQKSIANSGGTALSFTSDISDYESVTRAVAEVNETLGPIDILVNNAGWDSFKPFINTQPEDWSKIIDINLKGTLNMLHAILPDMSTRGNGRVINVSSDAARIGSSGEAVYSACKAATIGLTKSLAREHARYGITLNVICPGPTETSLLQQVVEGANNPEKFKDALRKAIPMGRLGKPDDLPGLYVFLASSDAAFITGQVISVSGGLTMSG